MNLKQAELIRDALERHHPFDRLKELVAVTSDGADEIAEMVGAREALNEYIKSQKIREAFECLGHLTKEEIGEACQRLKEHGRHGH
jgi:hypothetical protein